MKKQIKWDKLRSFKHFFVYIKLYKPYTFFAIVSVINTTQLMDPTQPPGVQAGSSASTITSPIQLRAIYIYPHLRIANINGSLVKTGDQVGEFTVINISRDGVELSGPRGIKQFLKLHVTVKEVSTRKGN